MNSYGINKTRNQGRGTRANISNAKIYNMRLKGMRLSGQWPNGMRPDRMRLKGRGSRERGLSECDPTEYLIRFLSGTFDQCRSYQQVFQENFSVKTKTFVLRHQCYSGVAMYVVKQLGPTGYNANIPPGGVMWSGGKPLECSNTEWLSCPWLAHS